MEIEGTCALNRIGFGFKLVAQTLRSDPISETSEFFRAEGPFQLSEGRSPGQCDEYLCGLKGSANLFDRVVHDLFVHFNSLLRLNR